MEQFKLNFYTWVTGHRKLIITVFLIMAVFSAILKPMVAVNYDMKDYLPEDSPSTIAIDVMQEEYAEGVPNARVMIKDVSIREAVEYKEKISAIEGVDSVTWLDDTVNPMVPIETVDEDILDEYYKGGNAVFQISIDKNKILTAVPEIRGIVGEESALTGDAVSTEVATKNSVKEIMLVTIVAVIMVLIILIFSTESWIEPLLILGTIGIAIIINSGTNVIFGEVSFVTDAAGSVLQLAVSLDYAVFLLHRYREYLPQYDDPCRAMIDAACRSTNSIFSSGVTTVIGFMALVLMRFLIGPDLGWALAKGIVISLGTVFVFLPAITLQVNKAMEKTGHRPLLPSFNKFGKAVSRIMIPMVCVFTIAIVPAFLGSNANSYYYGAGEIYGLDTELGRDTKEIEKTFGETDTYALLIPKGSLAKEKALSEEIKALPEVSNVISYVDTVGAEIPEEYLGDSVLSKLNSDKYTRMVVSAEIGTEGEEAFALIEAVQDIADKYYPSEYHLAGQGPSNYDLMDTITADMLKVNLVAIAAVYLVLVLMLRSFLLPFLLVISIETAVWINTGIPYFMGEPIFYLAYLIISSVQLGATVDYAILMTDRYRECRETLDKKQAVVQTIETTVPSILVSGLTLTIVGFLLGIFSTNGLLGQLGIFVGRGAVCSMAIVFFVLPGLLYLFDKMYINRGKKIMKKKKMIASALAVMMACVLCVPAASYADTSEKEEVIYGNLNHDGSVREVYAVNIFESAEVADFGDYSQVKNLTTTDKLSHKDGKVTVSASETPFYYQGDMQSAELPWSISADYKLNGKKYKAEDLAGKSGDLEIALCIKENPKGESFFYENYALQITMTMDGNYCRNIEADGATVANVGSDKQITYTVLPGSGADVRVSADVVGFEMDEISINGIKLNMDVDVDESGLLDEADKLEEGTAELDKGAADLKSGARILSDGSKNLLQGVRALGQQVNYEAYKVVMKQNGLDLDQMNMAQLAQANPLAAQLLTSFESYLNGVGGGIAELEKGAEELAAGSEQLYSGTKALKEGTSEFKSEASGIDDKISDEIDDMKSGITGSDEVRSFTSEKNTNVESVQFVMKTEAIKIPEQEVETEEEPEPGFFQKLIDLF